jgi:hypothetical protein
MPSDVEQAKHVLNNLRQKRDALDSVRNERDAERTKLSFAAHTGDKAARARLDKLNAEAAIDDSERRSLDSAVSEAATRVEKAQAAEARKEARRKAAEMRKHVDELAEVFPYLDRHLEEAARAFVAIDRGFAQLRQSGVGPSDAQFRLGLTSVVEAWAMRLPKHVHNQLRDGVRFLPPAERHTASEYWARVRASLDNQISQAAGEPLAQPPNPTKDERAA